MEESLLIDKSIAFAAKIVKLQRHLHLIKDKKLKIINLYLNCTHKPIECLSTQMRI